MTTTDPAHGPAIDLEERFSRFNDQWAPRRIATVNDYDVRIAKVQGEFVWHSHPETDEFFLVVSGRLVIKMRALSGAGEHEVALSPGQMFVVPRGTEHCPVADEETSILMFEPTSTPNTGDSGGNRTKEPEDLR